MNPRYDALSAISRHQRPIDQAGQAVSLSDTFGKHVFTKAIMQKMLPKEVYTNILQAMERKDSIKPEYADTIALAIKEWACSFGATHYTHWFQPLTSASAEKHDSFLEWKAGDQLIEKLGGKQLIQGEPDASSFPSGGLRSTYEARGYTGWDPSTPPFIWSGGDGYVLCIPTVFFSWSGDALDTKIPLLRSEKKISDATMRLLTLTGTKAQYVYSTLGCEQEYFVIDRRLHNMRPDLLLAGRTVFGASPAKGQELQDHYFGAVKDRILAYMQDFETAAMLVGIPVKTRHNEVAPAQHEIAPIFERLSIAVDHNLLLMELMRQSATKHGLACLLHEKPFHDVNGSGKHCNWSLSTDSGINLLDPTDHPDGNIRFLILLVAILKAVHDHSSLLRASIGSAANDFRLGGHEAPPAIISVYLGLGLENVLERVFGKKSSVKAIDNSFVKGLYDLGILLPNLLKDNTDRNRTSPFAFTGNKFEFRAVGASSSPAFPMTVLNVIVAESLNKIIDQIEANLSKSQDKDLLKASMPVIKAAFHESVGIVFGGDNYSKEWVKEAQKRKLPNIKKSIVAFEALVHPKAIKAFEGVLSKRELESRYEILCDIYASNLAIESKLMLELFKTHVLPAAMKYQGLLSASLLSYREATNKQPINQKKHLEAFTQIIEQSIVEANVLEKLVEAASKLPSADKKGRAFCDKVLPQCEVLRGLVDALETQIGDDLWMLPKYHEMLFLT